MSTEDLIEKLNAALDKTERIAKATRDTVWSVEPFEPSEEHALPNATWIVDGTDANNGIAVVNGSFRADHIVLHGPARELAMIEAHREILKWAQEAIKMCTVSPGGILSAPGEHMMGDIGRWNIEALAKAYGIEAQT